MHVWLNILYLVSIVFKRINLFKIILHILNIVIKVIHIKK